MSNVVFDRSPDSWGSHRASVFAVTGPAPYTRITAASPVSVPSAGGQVIQAVQAGLSLFDIVYGSMSDSGLYFVRCVPVSASSGRAGVGGQQSTYRLVWYVASTNVEVPTGFTLSNEWVRLLAVGTK